MKQKPDSPAARRNRDPILEVLAIELGDRRSVLEIGSGTGQHAVYFGRALPRVTWQTSDRTGNHAGIEAWLRDSGTENVLPPLALDVEDPPELDETFDAVFSANTAHIMSIAAVECMFDVAGNVLADNGVFCLYGPFNVGGEYSSESNRRFDESLRSTAASMGVRDIEALDDFAAEGGLRRRRIYAMPANNLMVIWQKGG